MSEVVATVRRRFRAIVLVVLPIVALAAVGGIKWPQETQAVSSAAGLLVAAVLVCLTTLYVGATYEYVKSSQEQLALLREQVEQERKVQFAFTLPCDTARAFFWAVNLGRTPIMIQRYRVSNGQEETQQDAQEFLPEGRDVRVEISDSLAKAENYWGDVEVAFDYIFAGGSATSEWLGFHLINDDGLIRRVVPGMREPEIVYCPKCEQPALMTAEGLSRFSEKRERAARSREQLAQSCPNRTFDWRYGKKAESSDESKSVKA
jgi:hypothetical protein